MHVGNLSKLASNFLQLVFAPRCLVCGAKTPDLICNKCIDSLNCSFNRCKICSRPLASSEAVCPVCLSEKRFFVKGFSLFNYKDEKVAKIIELIKFKGHYRLVDFLYYFKDNIIQSGIFENVDCLVAVPMHKKDIAERGFNQSVFIAKVLSNITQIKVDYSLIEKVKRTKHQVGLSAKERKSNLKGAFRLTKKSPYHKVVVVDDVFTTGSTINEIAKLFLSHRIKSNFFCVSSTPHLY
ncbi:amidophosphoribosyltransferase [Hippea maritima DSM 10411]|uniref:Amidophosphoribosyltransferase n=1 Tax=Hippea maritima (strain ATCC 700847 / DSM 10411 / MH2) TaxID=760142 RepID=F2LU77_HIPMA|nr:amidophosphoribosyltransferase [Hippea maritima DSM 10411]